MEGEKSVGICSDDGQRAVVNANPWEQRKFSELYEKSSEKNDGSIDVDRNITVATMQFKPDVTVSSEDYLKTYYTFNVGDIAFEGHHSKDFMFGRFVENDIGDGIVSHIFAVFRPIVDYDLYYWKYAIHNESIMRPILSKSTKASTMMHDLVTKDFLNESILVPSVDEQKKIGAYLNNLDNLITLHQRKPIPHPNHSTTHTKHKGEEKYVRIRVNDREKTNRTANLRRFPVDIPGGFKNGGGSVGEFQIYSGAE